jgi:hypothetical protein
MKAYRKIGVLLLLILLVIQFIQPKRNIGEAVGEKDISKVYTIPADLHQTLIRKCYDCHSNSTQYPWYFFIQPIGWWLAAHVHDGKEELNFSEFKTYDRERAAHKLEELGEVIDEGSMPIKAYTLLHNDTEITNQEAKAIKTWLGSLSPAAP